MKKVNGDKLLDVSLILKKAKVESQMKVADFGCGSSGYFSFPAAEIVGKTGKVYAVDILKTALENIKRRQKVNNLTNIIPLWSNLEIFNATRIESGSIDIVLLINTLYQSHHRVNILREAIRVLKKGGKIVVVDWKKVSLPFGPPLKARVDSEALIAGAKKLGLKLEEEFFAGQYHFGLIFTKI